MTKGQNPAGLRLGTDAPAAWEAGTISRRAWLAAAAAAGFAAPPAHAGDLKLGEAAPPFSIYDYHGVKTSSEDLKGKVVVLTFWASWCAPCRGLLGAYDTWLRAHPDADVRVIAVLAKDGNTALSELRPFAMKTKVTLATYYRGPYGLIDHSLPSSFMIDRNGVLRVVFTRNITAADFDQVVSPLLAASPAAPPPTSP